MPHQIILMELIFANATESSLETGLFQTFFSHALYYIEIVLIGEMRADIYA